MSSQEAQRRTGYFSLVILAVSLGVLYIVRQQGVFFCNAQYGFGLFVPKPFFVFLEVVVLSVLFWRWLTLEWCAEKMIFSILLVAGGMNFFERLVFGCVADYLTLPLIGSQINIPDIVITIMLGGLLWLQWKESSR